MSCQMHPLRVEDWTGAQLGEVREGYLLDVDGKTVTLITAIRPNHYDTLKFISASTASKLRRARVPLGTHLLLTVGHMSTHTIEVYDTCININLHREY